jgi:predicted DNA binding CopG/RHH family protein
MNKDTILTIRIDVEMKKFLKFEADKKGLPLSTFLRMWICENFYKDIKI